MAVYREGFKAIDEAYRANIKMPEWMYWNWRKKMW